MAEARALDRLLDRSSEAEAALPPAEARALTDRILAAALTDLPAGGTAAADSRNHHLSARERPSRQPAVKSAVAMAATGAGSRWHAAGLMAASLLVGIYLGGSVNLAPVLQELAEAVGIADGDRSVAGRHRR